MDAFEIVVTRLATEKTDLLDTVQELVAVVLAIGGGYMKPEHQATMRGARRLLVEHGRPA